MERFHHAASEEKRLEWNNLYWYKPSLRGLLKRVNL